MKASETQLMHLLSGKYQYVVPLFQRPYSWGETEWETLWRDALETQEQWPDGRHFFGSLVTKQLLSLPGEVAQYLVIDGQQRLTTTAILLAAVRDQLRMVGSTAVAEAIHDQYLINTHGAGDARYKVLPTQPDRPALRAIVDGTPVPDGNAPPCKAYRYFRAHLTEPGDDGSPLDLPQLANVVAGAFDVVSITLQPGDNEYRIFESLNGKGTPLSQADLLRNYFFMRIPSVQQESVYHDVWLPMQERLGSDLESLFRHEYLTQGQFVRESDIYQAWKLRLDDLSSDDELIKRLHALAGHARHYERLLDPAKEPDARIRRRLERLRRWNAQTAFPLLLLGYRRLDAGEINPDAFERLLSMIESFLVRRLFTRESTRPLARLFMRLDFQRPPDLPWVEGIRAALSVPGRRWPRDAEFEEGIRRHRLYVESATDQCRLILETLEESRVHKEPVRLDGLTVEHVMPQSLTPEWEAALGPDAGAVHERLLHVLGNLTLTGYNPELGNGPFSTKRQILKQSHMELNQEIAAQPQWTAVEIEERGKLLAKHALAIWAGPAEQAAVPRPPEPADGTPTLAEREALWTHEKLAVVWPKITPSARLVLRRLAATPDVWVTSAEAVAAIVPPIMPTSVGGVLTSLTAQAKKAHSVNLWPFDYRFNHRQNHAEYCMSATVAAWVQVLDVEFPALSR